MADLRYIPLTLTSHYALSWGAWEGVRELVQNWHDGLYEMVANLDIVSSTPLPVHFRKVLSSQYSSGTTAEEYEAYTVDPTGQSEISLGVLIYDFMSNSLTMINKFTSLHKRILLMGYSAKTEKKEVIGQFGEGLKVGALALVRDGRPVTMETSVDRWLFDLVHNKEFGEKVLTVIVSARPEENSSNTGDVFPPCPRPLHQTDTCAMVSNITVDEWRTFLPRFLFLKPPSHCVKTELGTLLLDDLLSGQLYVKGVWVADLRKEDLAAGVDFTSLQLDRDRNAVPKPSEIDHLISCMWIKAVGLKPELITKYYYLLSEEDNEAESREVYSKYRDVRHAAQYSMDTSLPMILAQLFISQHGMDVVPVLNNVSMQKLEEIRQELSSKVVLCNETMLKILHQSGKLVSVEDALSHLHSREFTRVPFSSLNKYDQDVLRHAIKLVQMADKTFALNCIDVVKTKKHEKCMAVGDRIDLPYWMLQLEMVHKIAKLCKSSQCKCREARICNAILELRTTNLAKDRQTTNLSTVDHPMQCIVSQLAMQVCHEVESTLYCVDLHSCAVIGYDLMSRQQLVSEFTEREAGYVKKIEQLEKNLVGPLTENSITLAELQLKLEAAEKEAMTREISLVDAEQKMRRHCEDQIEKAKAETKKSWEHHQFNLKRVESEVVELQKTVRYKDEQLTKLREQMKTDGEVLRRKEENMMEELQHYVDKHRTRTEYLSTICQKGCANKDGVTRKKCQKLADICDLVLQDLQNERFVCAVCKTKRKNSMFTPCGHYVYCTDCADTVLTSTGLCPVCKQAATGVQIVYE